MRRLSALLLVVTPGLASAQIWDQQPSADGTAYPADGISTNGSQTWSTADADDFGFTTSTDITSIGFWGGSEGVVYNDLRNFKSFDFAIYNANFTTEIFYKNVVVSSLDPVSTGNSVVNGFNDVAGGAQYYLTFNTNIRLGPGEYWLSIGSVNLNPNGDAFLWSASTADGYYAENLFDGSGWTISQDTTDPDQDQAFRLYSNPVPEPATMAPIGLGCLFLSRRFRRR